VCLNLVGESRVRHLEHDLVAVFDLVDAPERRQVRGPVARDPHRLALAGEGRAVAPPDRGRIVRTGVVPGPLLQAGRIRPLDQDYVQADAVDLDAPDALARLDLIREQVGEQSNALFDVVSAGDCLQVRP
jgi:hypothetical protein